VPRLACAVLLVALGIAGCGGSDDATRSSISAATSPTVALTRPLSVPAGNHGPHYFETPSHNIGCYLDSKSVRCDIRERDWSPPPEPKSCIKFGVDWGQGIAVGAHRASFVCAGDTVLGGPGLLGYGHSARRGPVYCVSRPAGITCSNSDTGHGFFMARARYRLF